MLSSTHQGGAENHRHPSAPELVSELAQLRRQAALDAADIASLQRALAGARRIGAAIGIVMMQTRCTEQDAFELLREVSQNSNRKLRDVADGIVHTASCRCRDRHPGVPAPVRRRPMDRHENTVTASGRCRRRLTPVAPARLPAVVVPSVRAGWPDGR